MGGLSPQVLVQLARRTVQRELKWKPTADHAPPIPDGAETDDPLAAGAPLDVRLLQTLGFRAYYDEVTRTSAWPVPLGLTPHELASFGQEQRVLYETPKSGDIFLQCGLMEKFYVHAGLVMTVDGHGLFDDATLMYQTSTVEGDTDHRGLLGRGYTCKLRRPLSPTLGDRFLRWSELDVAPIAGEVA